MDELIAWVRAALDEEAAFPDGVAPHLSSCQMLQPVPPGFPWPTMSCNCSYPDRVLAEVEAKRRILALHEPSQWGSDPALTCGTCSEGLGLVPWPCATVLALAQPLADRPGFKAEWRLTGG